MGDDDASNSDKNTEEVAPYRFKQKDEGVGKKLDNTFSNVSANRKTIAIIIGILILVIVGGTFTGNVIKTTSELNKCQASLEESYAQAAELSNNISALEGNIFNLNGNLSAVRDEKQQCEDDYSVCSNDATSLKNENQVLSADLSDTSQNLKTAQEDLSSCSSELEGKDAEIDQANSDKEQIEEKYASLVCCPVFYPQGYKYYISTGGEVMCCYKAETNYKCGFGPNEQETDEGQIKNLAC
jgi:DNA repair exonuclease SbcCD ATPase subunit